MSEEVLLVGGGRGVHCEMGAAFGFATRKMHKKEQGGSLRFSK